MTPIEFKEQNVIFAKDQPEYKPLPAHKSINGNVVTCWELTDVEIERIKETKCIFLSVKTFHQPLQPLFLTTEKGDVICLQKCESCETETDIETMAQDDDSNWFCPECWKELASVMKKDYEELKANGEIED